jgi:hypothetical protein
MRRATALVFLLFVLPSCGTSNQSRATTSPPATATVSSSSNYARRAQTVVGELILGNYKAVRAQFNATMRASLSEQQLVVARTSFVATFGSFTSQGKPEVLKRGIVTVVNVPLTMEKGPAQARISFDADGTIAGLYLLRPGVPVP